MSVGPLAFAVAAVVHLTFQSVVHVVVYPGLADLARAAPAAAPGLHARYTARMAVVVAPVYGLLAAGVATLVLAPGRAPAAAVALAVLVTAATPLLTGLGAVPAHRALARPGLPPAVAAEHHGRLRTVDRARLAVAAGQVAAAAWVVGAGS
ncbi:MAG: hypothetical protein ACFCVG_07040 [Kineosporiaceae bacterium]